MHFRARSTRPSAPGAPAFEVRRCSGALELRRAESGAAAPHSKTLSRRTLTNWDHTRLSAKCMKRFIATVLLACGALAASAQENTLQRALPGAGLLAETVQAEARNKIEITGEQAIAEQEIRAAQ